MATAQGDVIGVSARAEFDGVDDMINVFDFVLTTPEEVSDALTVIDMVDIMEELYTIWTGIQSDIVLYRDIRITNRTQSIILGVHPWPGLVDGDLDANAIPPGVCGVINFSSAVSRVTPRKFFGGLTVTSNEPDGTLAAGALTTLSLIATFLLTIQEGISGDWRYGVLSPKTLGFVFPNGAVMTDIPGYQRRRKQGRGS